MQYRVEVVGGGGAGAALVFATTVEVGAAVGEPEVVNILLDVAAEPVFSSGTKLEEDASPFNVPGDLGGTKVVYVLG